MIKDWELLEQNTKRYLEEIEFKNRKDVHPEIPNKQGIGVDIIVYIGENEIWLIQCKKYNSKYIRTKDIQTFLSYKHPRESSHKEIFIT